MWPGCSPIPFRQLRAERVLLEVPNLDPSVVRHRCEDRRSVGRPADIVDLLLQITDLVTSQLGVAVFFVPDSHGPIVGARDEDGAVIWMPVWIAPHAINWAHMSIVVIGVSLGERGGALVHRAILSRHEVVVPGIVHWEIDGKTARVDKGHSAGLLLINGSRVDIFLVGVGFSL